MNTQPGRAIPDFDATFRTKLRDLFVWRRDVRHFRPDPVPADIIESLVASACLAPSVGNSQPWRFVFVETKDRRDQVRESFQRANAAALRGYDGERRALYAKLKLAGLNDAPIQIAVFCDDDATAGHGLGRQTMPEMLRYSVVAAIQNFWLAARAEGLGVGWISILEPEIATRALNVPANWQLVAYLCVGWPKHDDDIPELEREGWQVRQMALQTISRR